MKTTGAHRSVQRQILSGPGAIPSVIRHYMSWRHHILGTTVRNNFSPILDLYTKICKLYSFRGSFPPLCLKKISIHKFLFLKNCQMLVAMWLNPVLWLVNSSWQPEGKHTRRLWCRSHRRINAIFSLFACQKMMPNCLFNWKAQEVAAGKKLGHVMFAFCENCMFQKSATSNEHLSKHMPSVGGTCEVDLNWRMATDVLSPLAVKQNARSNRKLHVSIFCL